MKPIGFGASLLYFGIPALTMAAGFYLLMPFLIKRGMLSYSAYSLGLGLPLLAMLIASLVAYRLEGNPLNWQALMTRFNYRPLSLGDLLVFAAIFAAEMMLYLLITRFTAGGKCGRRRILVAWAYSASPATGFCWRYFGCPCLVVDVFSWLQVLGSAQPAATLLWANVCRPIPEQQFRRPGHALHQQRRWISADSIGCAGYWHKDKPIKPARL